MIFIDYFYIFSYNNFGEFMNNNAGKGLLKAIVIVGVVFAILYFISYNKWLDHDFNEVDITYKTTDVEELSQSKEVDVTDEYKSLYSSINYEFLQSNYGEEFYNVYYGNQKFTSEYFILVGITNIIKNNTSVNCNYETVVTKDQLKDEIRSLFGNVSYMDSSFTSKNNNIVIDFKDNNYYVKVNGKCSGFDYLKGGIKNIYTKAIEDDDILYIYEKASYLENIVDSNGNLNFNYHSDINKNSTIIANSYEKVDLEKLPTYVYKFIKENGKYTLKEIKRK